MQKDIHFRRLILTASWLICVVVALGAASILISYFMGEHTARRGEASFLITGFLGLAACSLGVVALTPPMLLTVLRRPAVTINAEGVIDRGTSLASAGRLISWSDISAIGISTVQHRVAHDHLLVISLRDVAAYEASLSAWKRFFLKATRTSGLPNDTCFVNLRSLKITDDELSRALEQYAPAQLHPTFQAPSQA